MTAAPVRPARRPDLDAITAAYLRYKMQTHIEAAEKAVAGYNHVDRQLAHRYESPELLRSRRGDSTALADQAALLAFHRPMACMYAAALAAEIAYQDRPVPRPGEAVRPAPPPPLARPAVGESADGAPTPSGAGVSVKPRTGS